MANIKLSNIHKPSPAKFVKLGTAFIAVGSAIGGYSLTANNPVVGYVGLGFVAAGTFLTAFLAE
jgi:hypothetical protein